MFVFQWFPTINTTLAFDARDKCCRIWFYPLNDTYVDFVLGSTGVLLLLPSPLCAKLSVVVICAEFYSVLLSVVWVKLSAAVLGAKSNSVLWPMVESQTQCCGSLEWTEICSATSFTEQSLLLYHAVLLLHLKSRQSDSGLTLSKRKNIRNVLVCPKKLKYAILAVIAKSPVSKKFVRYFKNVSPSMAPIKIWAQVLEETVQRDFNYVFWHILIGLGLNTNRFYFKNFSEAPRF
jgi:hypothetical protein